MAEKDGSTANRFKNRVTRNSTLSLEEREILAAYRKTPSDLRESIRWMVMHAAEVNNLLPFNRSTGQSRQITPPLRTKFSTAAGIDIHVTDDPRDLFGALILEDALVGCIAMPMYRRGAARRLFNLHLAGWAANSPLTTAGILSTCTQVLSEYVCRYGRK